MSKAAHNPVEIERYATLDGLRGAAALMVALFHFQVSTGVDPVRGYLAVDLFFGISGFVLSAAYSERFKNGLDAQSFFALRIKRFYPLYACGLVLGLIALANGVLPSALRPREIGSASLFGLVMLPNFTSYQLFPLNGPSWSLYFELVINLILACWLWSRRSVELAFIVVAALIALVLTTHPPDGLNTGWNWTNVSGGAVRTVFSFVLGMLLYRAIGQRARRPRLASAFIPLIVLLMAVKPIGNEMIWDLGFVIVVCPLVLVAATTTEAPAWARPWMHWLGTISYALYAVHWPLATLTAGLLRPLPFGVGAAIFLGAAVLLAALLDKYVDRSFQSYFKRRQRIYGGVTTTSPAAP